MVSKGMVLEGAVPLG